MKFVFGGAASRRYRLLTDEQVFEWRPGRRDKGPVFRNLSWDFDEPDRYPALVAEQNPGFTAGKSEKAIHGAIASGEPAVMLEAAGQHPKYRSVAEAIAGLLLLETDLDRGLELLAAVVQVEDDVGKDRFLHKYLSEAGLSVVIAAGVMVHLPLQRNSLVLLIAELHQARGHNDEAMSLLRAAEPTTHIRLSLAELQFEMGLYEEVISTTQGLHNDDDVTALMLAYRGRALAELGREDEAVATLARALEYPNRAESVKAIALVGRGMIHQKRGEHILAQNDFTQALVEVPSDEDARQHIQELIHGKSTDN